MFRCLRNFKYFFVFGFSNFLVNAIDKRRKIHAGRHGHKLTINGPSDEEAVGQEMSLTRMTGSKENEPRVAFSGMNGFYVTRSCL